MTDTISKAAKAKALELSIRACRELKPEAVGDSYLNLGCFDPDDCSERTWEGIALARVLQEHSDKAKEHIADLPFSVPFDNLQSMILPDVVPEEPAPPDALHELLGTAAMEALSAAGYEIRRKDG